MTTVVEDSNAAGVGAGALSNEPAPISVTATKPPSNNPSLEDTLADNKDHATPLHEDHHIMETTEDAITESAEGHLEPTAPPTEETGSNSGRALILVLLSLALSLFLGSLDMTVVATALPTVARELGGLESLAWVATAYMLTSAAPQALWGRISDIFGRRSILLFNIALFIVASAICGAAPNMTVLIVGRALQGLGGGGLNSVCFIIVSEIVTVRQRGLVQGGLQVVFAVSSIVGPLLGGLFADSVGWRWIFWINLPVGALSFLGIFFFLKLHARRQDSIFHKLKTLDWFGAVSITAGSVLLLMGLTFGGQANMGWKSAATISCIVIGVALYPVFGYAEYKAKDDAMIPLGLFRIRNFALLSVCAFILGISMFGPTYLIPLWFQLVRDFSATNAGLAFLPGFIMSTIGGVVTGGITTKTGIVRPFFQVGFVVLALGMGLDSLWTAAMPYWQQAILLGLTGFGFGLVIVTLTLIVQSSVPGKEIGPATTAIAFLQTMGGILGLAVFNVVLANQINSSLPPQLDVIAQQYGISQSTMDYVLMVVLGGRPSVTLEPVHGELPPGSPQYEATVKAMQDATVLAFKYIFIAIGCVTVIPVVLSLFVQKPNLSGGTLAVLDGQEGKKEEEVDLEGVGREVGVASGEVEVTEKADKA